MSEVVFSYSRAEAIDDGVLVDVSATAKEAGFKFPVAITQGVYHSLTPNKTESAYQDFEGRLWDVLSMLRLAVRKSQGSQIDFKVLIARSVYNGKAKLEEFKAICGPGDNYEPVITILLPHED